MDGYTLVYIFLMIEFNKFVPSFLTFLSIAFGCTFFCCNFCSKWWRPFLVLTGSEKIQSTSNELNKFFHKYVWLGWLIHLAFAILWLSGDPCFDWDSLFLALKDTPPTCDTVQRNSTFLNLSTVPFSINILSSSRTIYVLFSNKYQWQSFKIKTINQTCPPSRTNFRRRD